MSLDQQCCQKRKTKQPMISPATPYLHIVTQVSDWAGELNWGTHSADNQLFYKKNQTQNLRPFLGQSLSLVYQVVTGNVCAPTKQRQRYKLSIQGCLSLQMWYCWVLLRTSAFHYFSCLLNLPELDSVALNHNSPTLSYWVTENAGFSRKRLRLVVVFSRNRLLLGYMRTSTKRVNSPSEVLTI